MENFYFKPQLKSDLVIEHFPNEVVVYDEASKNVHVVQGKAAQVFRLCDGSRTTDDIVAELGADEESEEIVVSAVAAFEEKGFLIGVLGSTRRQFLSRAASIAGIHGEGSSCWL